MTSTRIRTLFPKGCRVRLIAEELRKGHLNPRNIHQLGTVVGYGRSGETIRIKFDLFKSVITYHRDYVERLPVEDERHEPSIREDNRTI